MKILVMLGLILPTMAMAQTYQPVEEVLLRQVHACENAANAEIGKLTAENIDLKKQLDDLKAKLPPEPAKP